LTEHNTYCQLIFQKCERDRCTPDTKIQLLSQIMSDLTEMSEYALASRSACFSPLITRALTPFALHSSLAH
jgi:hypothetical protein